MSADRAVIGSILISRTALEDVSTILRPEHFEAWQHGEIFAAALSLQNAGLPVDVVTVTDRLIEQGDLDKIGGASVLHEMTSEVTTAANATYHATIVREAARGRALAAAAGLAAQAAAEGTGKPAVIAERLRADLEDLLDDAAGEAASLADGFDDVLGSLSEPPNFIPSPWGDLNPLIDGWRPGALYVVGARPGSGKSIMGLLAAVGLAKHGNVAMCSLEMSRRELTLRLISAKANVLMHALTRHVVAPNQWEAINRHKEALKALPLFVDDRSGVTMSDIRAHVRSVARRGPVKAIVIDYLQLIAGSDTSKPRWEAVGEITRELKALAREYQAPVIALAQLNRRTDHSVARPTLSDLRESGSIEQDADVVMLLQRLVDPASEEYTDELEVIVAKNRHGQTGYVTLFWEGAYTRISDMSPFG